MKITQAPAPYRQVTIVLETQDDYDKFEAVLHAVYSNAIHIAPQVIHAAREISNTLNTALFDED